MNNVWAPVLISPIVFVWCRWSCCLAAQEYPSSLITHFVLWMFHYVWLFCGNQIGLNFKCDCCEQYHRVLRHHKILSKILFYFQIGLWCFWKKTVKAFTPWKAAWAYFYLVSVQPRNYVLQINLTTGQTVYVAVWSENMMKGIWCGIIPMRIWKLICVTIACLRNNHLNESNILLQFFIYLFFLNTHQLT